MSLYVGKSKYGRGIFTSSAIKKGQVVEVCPCVPLTLAEYKAICQTKLENYVYTWIGPKQSPTTPQEKWSSACVVFGLGSMYNHSDSPNLDWTASLSKLSFTFKALRAIKAGEELTHDYSWPEWKRKETGIE